MIKHLGALVGVTTSQVVTISILVIIMALGLLGYSGYVKVKKKLRAFSKAAFQTEDFLEGLNKAKDELAEKPKSVTSMTSLMEPQITRDFPEFNWSVFKAKAETMLRSTLTAIAMGDLLLAQECSEEAKEKIRSIIAENEANDVKVFFQDIHIHQTEIANYVKNSVKCTIKIQCALEYRYYKLRGDKVIDGDRDRKTQTRYNLELVYIRDTSKIEFDTAVGVNCPNCGAPITSLGHMVCEYCGAEVTPINTKVWSLNNFDEVDYHHV